MNGTTLCTYCNTRFKIAAEQLEAHQGMVRCGHCLQAFNARPSFIPDQPNPQLELPMLNDQGAAAKELPAGQPAAEASQAVEKTVSIGKTPEKNPDEAAPAAETRPPQTPSDGPLDYTQPAAAAVEPQVPVEPKTKEPSVADKPVALTLAEQVAIVQEEDEADLPPEYRKWPWAAAASLLSLLVLAQAAYFFRVDLAAHLPGLKPSLNGYCRLLGCSVPLPQKTGLMSIESSDLEADAAHENQITLNALLRNRAPYAQAFPNLELTLNDTQDKPLARRIFKPKDYLPPQESEPAGLLPNRELSIKLYLGITDLRPTGYRLVLFYPKP